MFRNLKLLVPKFLLSVFLVLAATSGAPQVLMAQTPRCNPQTEQELSIGIQDPKDPSKTIYCVPKNTTSTNLSDNPIFGFLKTVIQFLTFGIGLALAGGLTAGGILIQTARGNSQQVQKGEEVIRNVIIGIVLYVLTFAIVNFLIPGGILN